MKFHHFAIETNNLTETADFYVNKLGFVIKEKVLFEGTEVLFLDLEGFTSELCEISEERNDSSQTHFCFETPDLKAFIDRMSGWGFMPTEGPFKLENGWETVFFEGPSGETIEFLSRRREEFTND
ncbi:hypothetical protein A8F94_01615 [Bacillus sp. FJAT-27225]|nr:hypothetical protein A8F94_01615 [Bacillus sp. FJAT-27225]